MLFRLGFLANGEAWGEGGGGGLLSITLKLAKLHMIMLWSFPTSKYNFTGALRKVNDIITS